MIRILNPRCIVAKLACLFLMIGFLTACSTSQKEIAPSTEYAPYVNAYTGGIISNRSSIRIELTQDQPMVDLNNELKENPFSFSPALKGKAYWVNNNTIEFVPDEGALIPGKTYESTFQLSQFVKVESKLKKFKFSFSVRSRYFTLHNEPMIITATQPDQVSLKGEVHFGDAMQPEGLNDFLSCVDAKLKKYPIVITATDNPSRYLYEITGLTRTDKEYQVNLIANGSQIGVSATDVVKLIIPAKGCFKYLSSRRIEQPENGIEVLFSSPISTTQHLKGLIEIAGVSSPVYQVKNNKILVFFEVNQLNNGVLNIHEGLKDFQDKQLGTSHSIAFSEFNPKPQVEMNTSAAILPDSKSLIIPFRAVNLKAVDLSVIRIFESNVLAFMQNNTLESANELRRAGRLVYKKKLQLNENTMKYPNNWNDYSIDLAGLIKQEPGAIYRVVLSFQQEYSTYPCGGVKSVKTTSANNTPTSQLTLTKPDAVDGEEIDDSEWDIPQSYFYYNGGVKMDWSQYDWRERNNPCHPSYYMDSDKAASCNVFASSLGMIVKRNSQNGVWVALSNILDTKPVEKAKITAYNFQLQPLGTAQTDDEGFAKLTVKGVPFIVVAEADKQKAYVRVVDGEEQSVSRFDVGGKEIQKGLKGFIYGERGVWRPGDTLHISFMLEDREKRIPSSHPVALEIYNPRGQFHNKMIATQGLNGCYTFHVPTKADDPTGLWNAYIKVGGTAFHKSFRIETVKPNRLKINLKLPQELIEASTKEIPVTLTSAWLTGATASHLKAKVEMSLSRVNTQFNNYSQYTFNDPSTEFTAVKSEHFNGMLDTEGKTTFALKLPQATQAPGMLNATLTTRVFEPGGDASIYLQNIPFSPFASYVGINLHQPKGKYLETDKEHTFDVVTVNAHGKLMNRSNLEYKIYRVDWSWWWENREESFGTYINSSSITPVANGNLQTIGGKASIKFRIDHPSWGRYLVYVKDREGGHATGGTVYIDWPEWRGRANKSDPSGIKMLSFTLNKEGYEIGETASATLPASAGGRALVSLENGTTLLKREWIEIAEKGDTKYNFKVTPEMAPNVYLHVTLLQPHAQTVNDLPIRMYGVMPVLVSNKQTMLQPQIQMPSVLRPETNFNITVSEKSGKPMTYTLAVVDDGLLDLTNFNTPNPWNEFYARESLGIRTWDMYDHVLGASAGRYSSLFSTGGDEMLKPADAKANRFKPVVKFIGPFYIGKGKQQIHQLKLPMYVGSVRTMVVAAQDGAYGQAEKNSYVRTPLMLLSTLPRVLSIQEEIILPVNLFAMEKEVTNATVNLKVSGAGVQVVGAAQQSVSFQQPGDKLIFFRLKTGGNTGKATIQLTASGGGQQAKEIIEIEVRNPNPAVSLRSSQWVEGGKSATLTYGMSGVSSKEDFVALEVSRIPSVDISRRFDYLYNYTHSCTEQLTSKALPLLFVGQFKTVDKKEAEQVKRNVQEGIQQLYGRQLPNGGFAYWPGSSVADEWITSYAGMFLALAQEKGYAVNFKVLNKWKGFQRAAAQNWRISPDKTNCTSWQHELMQAYRLYTLALIGAPEQGAMNRMKEQVALTPQAKWRLAATYALTGKMKPAGELVFNAETSVSPYSSQNSVYGSSLRDEAMILETLLLMNRKSAALQQAKKVSKQLAQEDWFDTQSTSFALMAMGCLADKLSGSFDFAWSWNGKQQPAVKSAKAIFAKTLSGASGQGSVTVKNQGKGALSIDLTTRLQLQNDTLPAISKNLRINVKYVDMNATPINPLHIKQGTDFVAVVTVANISASSDYSNLALTHILPSGWEVMPLTTETATTRGYTYRDIRDDRVLTYFDLSRGELKPFAVRLQATYEGEFVLPAIQCEAMYDASAQARTRAGRTTVGR